jgi:hypothetical protein
MTDEEVEHLIDVVTDELALARAQIDAGQTGMAEGTLRRRLARLEAEANGPGGEEEADALRLLLAESLWRQGRPMAARVALEAIRPGSPQRRLPMGVLIDAETLAAAGETDRAAGAQERLLTAIGADESFALRGGVPGRLSWPLPAELRSEPARAPRPPWASRTTGDAGDGGDEPAVDDARVAAARGRLEEARVAYVAGELRRGDGEMGIALRLDPGLAGDGVTIIEPTLGKQPDRDRLLLYGDLLRAAGREVEAQEVYDRATSRRGARPRGARPSTPGEPTS